MAEINLSDYVLESKEELISLANAIREKSGTTGELSVVDMKVAVEGISGGDDSLLKSFVDRSITEMELPSGITIIGPYAFRDCRTLKSVKIPEGVTKIDSQAFYDCKALESVDFPDGLETIASYAFYGCNILKKIKLLHGLKNIYYAAFQNAKLEEVELPSTLENIEQSVFKGTNLMSITLPNSIKSMHSNVFNGSDKLTKIYCDWVEGDKPTVEANAPWGAVNADIVYTRTVIDADGTLLSLNVEKNEWRVVGFDYKKAPTDYSSIDLVIESEYRGIPVTEIADNAFDKSIGCPVSLKSIVIPDTVKRIGSYAFNDQSLTSVTIPDSVNEVGAGAFYYNYDLKTATFGSGLEGALPVSLFVGCGELTDIYLHYASEGYENAPWGAPETVRLHYGSLVPMPDDWT